MLQEDIRITRSQGMRLRLKPREERSSTMSNASSSSQSAYLAFGIA
jgi:hypothetical protein